MAGMLPGVECARRRRFHGGASPLDLSNTASVAAAATGQVWTRRPSFSLYTTSHECHQAYVSFSETNVRNKSYGGDDNDEKLVGAAKEAKERLDERLRNPRRKFCLVKQAYDSK
ncbi:unnamed protein product [Eruca vesicaria subsp. sativa]|uniref:Uncharacterized protein n=1 Tax=Eruca vesicaria subsp. sativa TaxID=29727 RepID=A0ABC8LNX8_ERUVS|nr:unnamed protein product [Eruca vesicaria subsp. sativa]